MTGRAAPVRRRPRRSNTLKDIGRLIGIASTAHEDRKDRLLAKVRKLSDTEGSARSNYFTIQTVNLVLRRFGVQLIANDRVLHVLEEWPGAIGAAWLDDGPAGDALRYLKAQALDRGAPAPLAKQGSRERRSAVRGGATAQEKRLSEHGVCLMAWTDWTWVRPNPAEQSTASHEVVENRPAVKSTYFQTRMPSGKDIGAVEPVFYIVADDVVKLCDEHGALTGKSRQLKPGEDAQSVASLLGRQVWSARGGANDFNRPIHYDNSGLA
jgi:hypothetical protein